MLIPSGSSLVGAILCLASFTSAISLPSFASSAFSGSVERRAAAEPAKVKAARKLIKEAQAQVKIRNEYFIKNAHTWANTHRPTTNEDGEVQRAADFRIAEDSPLNFVVNATIKDAAALLAEYDAEPESDEAKRLRTRQNGAYWLENMQHGKSPFGGDAGYRVWRNVRDFGARGDGVTDDTAAINAAIAAQNRCAGGCGSSTTKFAVVYFPPGTYLVSGSLFQYYNTQMIGNPNNRPVIKASGSFVGLGVISSNKYIDGGGGAQWYIPQSNFLRQIRNFVIDIRSVPNISPAGIHWQIAQATSLQNIEFLQSTAAGNNHQGVYMENGSGGMIGDLVFNGGAYGMYVGNQQFTSRNLRFINCRTAVSIHWNWGWTFKSLDIQGSEVGLSIVGDGLNVGSALVMDSRFSNTPTAILVRQPFNDGGQTNTAMIAIDNVRLENVATAAVRVNGGGVLLGGGTRTIESWGIGKKYLTTNTANGEFSNGGDINPRRSIPGGLLGGFNGGYFERSKPQYEGTPASGFTNVLNAGARGDGHSDDTAVLNRILAEQAGRTIVFFPAGTYIVTDTLFIPIGSKIVGEGWAQIMGQGARFSNIQNPYPVVKVGNPGQAGVIEIQDMMVTVRGATAGAVLMQWNVKESARGSAAMWDTHFRIGGAAGSNLSIGDCPKLTGQVNPACISGAMLLHLTPQSSAYMENIWAWVADHDLDIPAQSQIDIYVARGILIESRLPTWLYGTASEHCVLYQYQTVNAANLFMGMIQTESPYFQKQPPAPEPFRPQLQKFAHDPTFSNCAANSPSCAMSWGLRVVGSSNIYIYGAGLYSWFQQYTQGCLDTENCQDKMVEFVGTNRAIWLYNLITKASVEMISGIQVPVMASANHYGFASTVMAWLGQSG